MSTVATPITGAERSVPLDTLRGVAILGILVMNIQSWSMPTAAYINPTAFGNLTGLDWWAWLSAHLLADRKFVSIFSVLFGAGIVLFSDKAEARGGRPAALHYRRMIILLLFGLLHAYLLWFGDILVCYALCGMIVFPLRRLRPNALLAIGLGIFAFGSLLYLFFGWSMQFWPAESIDAFRAAVWSPSRSTIERELAVYRGGWWLQMTHRAPETFMIHTRHFLSHGLWRTAGLMLAGIALFRWGILTAQRSTRFYVACAVGGALLGIPLALIGVSLNSTAGWNVRYSFFVGRQWNGWASLPLALSWIALVMVACQRSMAQWLLPRLAAVGRTAFSNYILQTLIGVLMFYGTGLGLFGWVGRADQLAIVPAIWALQLVLAPTWLRHFRFGPLEWLWRSLTYGSWQPIRRYAAGVTVAE